MGIGKKIRFEIFKRDSFACRYCGRKPPEVTLEADHVIAKAQGGADVFENLVTACFDCNRGKSKNGLKGAILRVRDPKAERKAARVVKELQRLDAEREDEIDARTDVIYKLLNWTLGVHEDYLDRRAFRWAAKALTEEALFKVEEIVETWANRQSPFPDDEDLVRYFMGVCKHKIKETYGSRNG